MLKFLTLFLMVVSCGVQAGSITGTIQVSLTILPAHCITTSDDKAVHVICGDLKQQVQTVVEKNTAVGKDATPYLVTITY